MLTTSTSSIYIYIVDASNRLDIMRVLFIKGLSITRSINSSCLRWSGEQRTGLGQVTKCRVRTTWIHTNTTSCAKMERSVNYDRALQLMSPAVARCFIKDKLLVDKFDEKFSEDRLCVLEEMIVSWQDKIPFQTVTQMAVEPALRKMPSMEENVAYILSLQGGRCWTQNTSMHVLLTALGYDARLLIGSVFGKAEDHAIVLVKGITNPNSNHIVDVGFGNVSPKAVCLDFDKESEVVEGVHKPYKYMKEERVYIKCNRHHEGESAPPELLVKDGWGHWYFFKLEERTYDYLRHAIGEEVYRNMNHFFNRDLFLIIIPGIRFVFLHNSELRAETAPGGEMIKTVLESDDDVIQCILTHFPSLPDDDVRKAVTVWRKINGPRKSSE